MGLDPSWLDVALLGRPDFQPRGSKIRTLKGLGPSGLTTKDPTPILLGPVNKSSQFVCLEDGVLLPKKIRGLCAIKSVKVHVLCRRTRDFYAIRPLVLWYVLGASVLLVWG